MKLKRTFLSIFSPFVQPDVTISLFVQYLPGGDTTQHELPYCIYVAVTTYSHLKITLKFSRSTTAFSRPSQTCESSFDESSVVYISAVYSSAVYSSAVYSSVDYSSTVYSLQFTVLHSSAETFSLPLGNPGSNLDLDIKYSKSSDYMRPITPILQSTHVHSLQLFV